VCLSLALLEALDVCLSLALLEALDVCLSLALLEALDVCLSLALATEGGWVTSLSDSSLRSAAMAWSGMTSSMHGWPGTGQSLARHPAHAMS
jgi:hypothetical protein